MTDAGDELDVLRAKLDVLDGVFLQTAALRGVLVAEIAKAKAAGGAGGKLFDRERERDVYERARARATELGMSETLAENLMTMLVEHSQQIQEGLVHAEERGADAKKILVVGGAGRMGRRFVEAFAGRGHDVKVIDPQESGGSEATPAALADDVAWADVVMLAVPMAQAVASAREVGPLLREGALLCDINSLKQEVCAAMIETCAGECVGLHPMFGPSVHSLRRQKVVYCPLRPGKGGPWLCAELERIGLELVESTPEEHDQMMAVVQVLVHFSTLVMGHALRRTGVSVARSLAFTSPIYRLELAFVGRLFAQDPKLYAEIEMQNPRGAQVRRAFLDAGAALAETIEAEDRDAFEAEFMQTRAYFEGFATEAMQLSDGIIDGLVRKP
jgi:chorismate mutase/prephenate dehydrogenase